MRRRALALGGAASALLYVGVALLSFRTGLLPVRPLYDGSAPPVPYRWVNPPPELAPANVPPEPGRARVVLTSEELLAQTDDLQAQVVFHPRSLRLPRGEDTVIVQMDALDPATFGPPPPGLHYNGNAYRFSVRYARSGRPARVAVDRCPELTRDVDPVCPFIVLRTPFTPSGILRREPDGWVTLGTYPPAGQQVSGDVERFGTFVAVSDAPAESSSGTGSYVALALGAAAVLVAIAFRRSRANRRKRRRAPARRPKPKRR